jgi:hypothetical protein
MSRQKSGVGLSAKSLVPNSAFVVLKGSLMGYLLTLIEMSCFIPCAFIFLRLLTVELPNFEFLVYGIALFGLDDSLL